MRIEPYYPLSSWLTLFFILNKTLRNHIVEWELKQKIKTDEDAYRKAILFSMLTASTLLASNKLHFKNPNPNKPFHEKLLISEAFFDKLRERLNHYAHHPWPREVFYLSTHLLLSSETGGLIFSKELLDFFVNRFNCFDHSNIENPKKEKLLLKAMLLLAEVDLQEID